MRHSELLRFAKIFPKWGFATASNLFSTLQFRKKVLYLILLASFLNGFKLSLKWYKLNFFFC